VPTDLELFEVSAEDSIDDRGRLVGGDGITIASTVDGHALFIGTEVPDDSAAEMTAAFDQPIPVPDPNVEPPALAVCASILQAAVGPLRRSSGPYYVFPPDVRFDSGVAITRSDDPEVAMLRDHNPGNWLAQEWDELLDGRLGPWAMATEGRRVISICHTPRVMSAHGAECGVWSDPDFRGQGHAAAVTAAWAAMVAPTGRHLFYSTDADNRSSQRVASRLNLRTIAWQWKLGKAREEPAYYRHAPSQPDGESSPEI
jgi:RimJ/RimL family protein N-acetyltransferase